MDTIPIVATGTVIPFSTLGIPVIAPTTVCQTESSALPGKLSQVSSAKEGERPLERSLGRSRSSFQQCISIRVILALDFFCPSQQAIYSCSTSFSSNQIYYYDYSSTSTKNLLSLNLNINLAQVSSFNFRT